ncbi:tetratricopeptide repeat protein [Nubsella zeaxanthinifaciens]|uniref:tetratricopeptide repeat protein n=1 Tax=Nubsella zeaxanthinifaciens TaxID=392412 RepID=UPI003D0304DC
MKWTCLTMVFVTAGLFASAQNPTVQGAEAGNGQLSVNISVVGGQAFTIADSFFDEAEKFERSGDYDNAVAAYNRAAKEYQEDKKYARYGATLIKLSNAHLVLSNYAEAEKIVLKQVLKNYTRIGSKSGQMAAYQQLGKIYLAANKLPQSLWFYTQHGILAQQLNDKSAYIESVIGIASVKIKKKDYLLASKDLNNAELLSKNANIVKYNQLIKSNRAIIAEKTTKRKA